MSSTVQVQRDRPNQARQRISFAKPSSGSFYRDVTKRVDDYFKQGNVSRHANTEMILKTVLILIGWLSTYLLILSGWISPPGMYTLALLHGFFAALIGLNIAHDAIHGSYAKRPVVNKRIGLIFNIVGANDYVWDISHNKVHHTFTNIPHHDEDINQPVVLRMEKSQKLRWIHRYQHIYAFFLYSLASLSWVLVKDYVKFFQHQLGGHFRESFPRKEIIRLFFYKAVYYTLFLVLPLLLIDLPWYWIIFGFVSAHLVEGFVLAIIFMLAHVVEGTSFPEPDQNGEIDIPWAELQMITTSNFAIKNRLINYLFGGLNFQVEHHLFPKVCHVHYPKISQIIKQTARDHNLPYLEHETFFGAIASHRRILRKLGRPENKA